jgi:hypothetical protein
MFASDQRELVRELEREAWSYVGVTRARLTDAHIVLVGPRLGHAAQARVTAAKDAGGSLRIDSHPRLSSAQLPETLQPSGLVFALSSYVTHLLPARRAARPMRPSPDGSAASPLLGAGLVGRRCAISSSRSANATTHITPQSARTGRS